jgi:hypothetical protein
MRLFSASRLAALAAIIFTLANIAGVGALVIAEVRNARVWAGEARKCASAFGSYDAVCVSTPGLIHATSMAV